MIKLLAFTMLLSSSALAKRWLPIHSLPKPGDTLEIFSPSHSSDISDQSSKSFNITVWNMYKGKEKSWRADFHSLVSQSDFLITQEIYLDKKMREVFNNLPNHETITAASFLWKEATKTGVATLSNNFATNYEFIRSKTREPIVKTPKIALLTTHELKSGESLLIANIHAVNLVSSKKLKRQLKSILDKINQHYGPVIFAGDFNTWTKKKTRMLKALMNESNLIEVKFKEVEDHRMTFNKKVLDYVFYKNLKLNSAKVLGEIKGADHKPIAVSFSPL